MNITTLTNVCLWDALYLVLFLKKIATFLHITVAKRRGLETLDHYLDDFSFAGQDSTNGCQMLMSAFQKLCVKLEILLAEDKTTIMFLGLEIDTVLMLVRIPEDKLIKLKESLLLFISRAITSVKSIHS